MDGREGGELACYGVKRFQFRDIKSIVILLDFLVSKMWERKPKKVGARARGGTDGGGPGSQEEPPSW